MITRRIKCFAVSCVLVITCLSLYGCTPSQSTEETAKTGILEIEPIPTDEESSESASIETSSEADTDTKAINVTVANLSKVDVGMLSVLDPITGEQANVDGIASEGSLAFQCKCPITTKELQWAVYDDAGDLLLESATDLSDCKGTISILLSGEETIDDVDVFFN